MAKADKQSKAQETETVSSETAASAGAGGSDEGVQHLEGDAALRARIAELEAANAELDERAKKMLASAPGLRKMFAKQTGRYVPKAHYRFHAPSKAEADRCAAQGLSVTEHALPDGKVVHIVYLPPPPPQGEPPAYELPEQILEHALACEAIEPELR